MASPRLSVSLSAFVPKYRSRRKTTTVRKNFIESLEHRWLLAVASPPIQPLPVSNEPIAVESGFIDNDPVVDIVSLSRSGRLSIALNANDGSWRPVTELDLGIGVVYGMTGSSLNSDPYLDLIAIGTSSARLLYGDGVGSFRPGPQLNAPIGGRWQPTDNLSTVAAVGLLNDDLQPDIVLLDTLQNKVAIYYGSANDEFAAPVSFNTGGTDPTALAIGDVVGNQQLDLVVGHRDGTISFLNRTAVPGGLDTWTVDTGATLRNSAAIRSLAVGDFDGDRYIAVSTANSAFVLDRQSSPLQHSPIANGAFDLGLTGWKASSVGQRNGQTPGRVSGLGGMAELTENSSLLTSLEQTFVVPPNPQSISVSISAIDLEYVDGAIPDALELSLLDSEQASLVATHRGGTTSYFNASGSSSGVPVIRMARGVSFANNVVTLDISHLTPGTRATLAIDLVGNPPGESSTASIDNVDVTPHEIFSNTFATVPLPGAFTSPGSLKLGDVSGDGTPEIVLADGSGNRVIVFSRTVSGGFAREDLDLTTLGGLPASIHLAQLDKVAGLDIAIAMPQRDVLLTPLSSQTSSSGRWLPDIDFERDALGNQLRIGAILDNEFASWGVNVSGPGGSTVKPVILDWSRSIDRNVPGATALGKVLSLANVRDHDHDDHDDDHCYVDSEGKHRDDQDAEWRLASGTIAFAFESPVMLDQLGLLGVKSGSVATVRIYGANGFLLQSKTVAGNLDGAEQIVRLDARNVAKLEVEIRGKAAVSQIVFNRDVPAGSRIRLSGSNQAVEGATYSLGLASPLVVADQWLVNWGDGRIDTLPGDPSSFTHLFADGSVMSTIFATARDLQGNVYLANLLPVEVANVPPTLTVSGPATIESGRTLTLMLSVSDPGQDRLKHWVIEWGDGTRSSYPGTATTATHVYKLTQSQSKSFIIRAMARDEDTQGSNAYRSNDLSVTVTNDTSRILPTIDFERDDEGSILRAPVNLSDQFASLGMSVSSSAKFPRGPLIIDSSRPSSASRDIGTPNSSFKGPGYGLGGNRSAVGSNSKPQKNVLILASDVRASHPEDYELGGTLQFQFAQPVRLDEIHLLDIDKNGSFIKLYTADGSLISTHLIPRRGVNSFQVVRLDASHVSRMELVLYGGGAVAAIVSQRGAPMIARPDSRFFVADADGLVYRYSAPGSDLGDFSLPKSSQPRGIASDVDSNPLWVISEEGNSDRVLVIDSTTERVIGSWQPRSIDKPEGIATNGTDIWIVDSATQKVSRFAGAALRRNGSANPTSSFKLHAHNARPTDLVTDGTWLWVVDAGTDRVHQYDLQGRWAQSWALDPNNADPAGIAIQPNQSDGIYVLDGADRKVYVYAHRSWSASTPQSSTNNFRLSAGNLQPIGLADPGGELSIGDVVNETLSAGMTTTWTFDASQDQSLYLNFQSLDATLSWDLLAPNGSSILSKAGFRPSSLDSGTLSIATTGTYSLVLTAGPGPATYQFQIFDVPGPDLQAISIGQTMAGALNSPGRPDHWTFSGTAGATYYLNFLSIDTVVGGDLVVQATSPSGQVVSTRTATRESSLDQMFTLTESGQWTIAMSAVFDGSHLPSYSFQLTAVPTDDVSTIGYRQSAIGTIQSPGARDRWLFNATENQEIFFDMQLLTGGDTRVQIVDPGGAIIADRTFSLASGLDQHLTLPTGGQYTVIVDGGGSANLIDYRFVLWDIPPETVQTTLINTTLSGQTVPGQIVRYAFDGLGGTPILLDVIESAGLSLGVTLIAPDGSTLVDRAPSDLLTTLPATGRYEAIVQRSASATLDAFGTYAFRVQDRSTPVIGRIDNLGTKFYVAFPQNLRQPFGANNPVFSLTITSAVDTSGTVQVPGLPFMTSFEVRAGEATRIELPSTVEIMNSDRVVDQAVLVTALNEVAVYGLNRMAESTDGFTALPVDAIGTDYYVLGYANTIVYVVDGGTNLTIAASEDNTVVTITPTVDVGSHPANVPFTVSMNAGQAYTLHTSVPFAADLSGTRVTSTRPISLFGGNTAARVPVGVPAADHLIEQLPPTNAWGSRFATIPLASRLRGDVLRILAQQSGTQVRINGTLVATLNAGQLHETIAETSTLIESTAPVLVAQYSTGTARDGVTSDPFMMLIPPTEQFLTDYTLSTPLTGIDINYANLIIGTEDVDSLRMDGQPISTVFRAIGTSGLSGASIPISVGSHRFEAAKPFGLAVYGFADFDSYGYFGGMSVSSVARVDSLTLSPATAELPVGTVQTLTAIALDASRQALPNVRIDFTIEGVIRETRVAYTDADGRASIDVTRTSVGVDRITAVAGGRSQVAILNWQAGAPQITVTSPAPGSQVLIGPRLLVGSVNGGAGATVLEVTVNGIRVPSLDSSGNFFAPVDVSLGSQNFIIAATNSAGVQASTTISLTGVANNAGQLSNTNTSDITSRAAIRWSATTYQRSLGRLLVDMQLVNLGSAPVDGAVAARFDMIEPSRVTLNNPDTQLSINNTAGSRPAMLFDTEIGTEGLLTNQSSQPIEVGFGVGLQDRFDVAVTLLARTNRPPRITSVPDPQATVASLYRSRVEAVDPDGTRLTYSLLTSPAGMTIDANGELSWLVQANQVGSHQVSLQVSDGRGGTATQRFTLTASASLSNRPPLIVSAPITSVQAGSNYRYPLTARDPDGHPLTYTLIAGPAGMAIDASTGLVTYDSAQVGVYQVELGAADGRGGAASQRFQLSVGSVSSNVAPRIISTPPINASVGGLYIYTVGALDPQQSPLTYSLVTSPAGMQIDAVTGRITWRPAAQDLGVRAVRVEARNASGGIASQAWTVAVAAAAVNAPPVFNSQPVRVATAGSSYAYNSVATDNESPVLYALLNSPSGMNINRTTGRVNWSPSLSQLGNHLVLITAIDALGATSFQQYQLVVRGPNLAPQFTSTPNLKATVGAAYRYNAVANDTEDEITYSLTASPSGMLIDSRSGAITYQATPAHIGTQSVIVRAIDSRGLSATQSFTVQVSDDTTAPNVSINLSNNNVLPGEGVKIQVVALDNSGIATVVLNVDGQVQPLDNSRSVTYVPTRPGLFTIEATATDVRGNSITVALDPGLRVIDSNDTQPPLITIDSPIPGQLITYLHDVMGTVTDENLEFYQLEISPAGQNQWRSVFSRHFESTPGIDGITGGLLGAIDPTLLANDVYELRVLAQDISGNQSTRLLQWFVEAGAKLGNYQFTASQNYCGCGAKFVDLELPLAGIPIRITRSYDTLDAPFMGDFGFGWTMEIANPRINESVRISPSEAAGGGPLAANPFRVGSRVYLNAPDGRRVGFTFDPVPIAGLLGAIWSPRFVADPGVEMELQVDSVSLSQQDDGTFTLYLFGLPYNPDRYTLITRDQLRYTYDQFADNQLQSITNRHNVQLTFDERGIHSSLGPEILWTRDDQGRITSLIDPAGNRLQYRYDARGDLVEFENQVGDLTKMQYLVDPAHYLQSVIDPHGQQIALVKYDDAGRVAGVVDAIGNSTRQAYDLSNNREVIADRMGNETTIVFDDRGNVTQVTDSQGSTVTTEYDARDRATRVTDPRGFVTQITYDAQSNPIRVVDALGQVWTATYNEFNDLLTRINPLGEINSYQYDAFGNMIRSVATNGAVTLAQYDAAGRITQLTDVRNQIYRFEYAGFSEPTLVVHPDGSQRRSQQDALGRIEAFTDENGGQVRFQQDGAGRVQEIIAPDGTSWLLEYDHDRLVRATDPLGRTTRYEYDEKGRLTGRFQPTVARVGQRADMAAREDTGTREFLNIYDPNDYLVSQTDALGRTTQYFYDPNGNLQSVVDALGRRTTFGYDEAYNLDLIIDPAGRTEQVTYDGLNRATTYTDAAGGQWFSQYDALGYVTRQIDPRGAETRYEYATSQLTKLTNPLGQVVEYTYDPQGNVTNFKDERGFITTYEYDARNRLISQTDPQGNREQWSYDDFGLVTEYVDPMGARTINEYDQMHRLVRAVGFSGGAVTYQYDEVGNVIQVTDPLGRSVTNNYDERNRMVQSIDARSGVTSYTYDDVDNLLSLTDPVGNTTQWEYDSLDRNIRTIDPLAAVSTSAYDLAGNLAQIRDRLGRVRNFTYDELDRLTREVWVDAAGTTVDTRSFTYDSTGNMLTAVDGDSGLTFTYDLLGQLTTASNESSLGGPRVQLSYAYDDAGNRTRVSDNFLVRVDSAYDSRNLLVERNWTGLGISAAQSARVGMVYNARGQRSELSRFSSVTAPAPTSKVNLSYDASGRVTQIRNANAADAVLASYDMSWDLADQLSEWNINGQVQRFVYDTTGQLTSVARGGNPNAESYQYDLNGNRQNAGQTIGVSNRLLSDSLFTYQYDAEGNRTSQTERATERVTSFTYDHENHLLTGVTRSTAGVVLSSVRYDYDAVGRRIARTADSDGSGPAVASVEHFVYDGDEVWLDADATGTVTARYLHDDGTDALLARFRVEDGLNWYITDHLGSVRGLLDSNGNLLASVDYDAFGNVLGIAGNAAVLDRYGYTGREFDSLIHQYHYRTRQYDPRAGIFTTEDTIGFFGGDANLNRYTGNVPTYARDPSGTSSTVEMMFTLRYGEEVGRGAAGAEIGFALGYICGFVEAWYENQDLDFESRFAAASTTAIESANTGASIGMLMGVLGASSTAGVRWATMAYGVLLGIESVLSSPDKTVLAIRSLCIVSGVALGVQASKPISPAKFRLRSIADHPLLHKLWEQSIRELYKGKGDIGKALRHYLKAMEKRKPTGDEAREAYKSVRQSFMRKVRNAMKDGEKFDGYSFDELHHWNWFMKDHALHAIDPRHIFPMSNSLHEAIHTRTTIGPIRQPLDIYFQPINPKYIYFLDNTYPLAPM